MRILKFSLLENALDSLIQGMEFVLDHRDDQSKLKIAILLVTQAVELVLKERLRREHWSLIYRKLEQAGDDDAFTVTVGEAVKRLEQIAGIRLSKHDGDVIDGLQRIRNRVQHHEIQLSFELAVSQLHAAIALLMRFLHRELEIDIKDLLDEQAYQRLLEVERIVEELRDIAQARIEQIERDHLPVNLSDRAAWRFDVIDCPKCWEKLYVFSPDSNISECQLCGYEGGFVECDRCGEVFPEGSWDVHCLGDELVFCDNCWSYLESE